MFVNSNSLASLQIVGTENHPNHVNQGDRSKSGAKESLSLHGLFRVLTHTVQGKTKLRQLFLRPTTDLDLIHERQRTISVLLRLENSAGVGHIGKLLRKTKNIKPYLQQLKKGISLSSGRVAVERGIWATLQAFCAYTIELREAVQKIQGAEDLAITTRVRKERINLLFEDDLLDTNATIPDAQWYTAKGFSFCWRTDCRHC